MTAAAPVFGRRRRPRRPSLTPMIDVVFLLLVFFMLAARFGTEGAIEIALAAPGPTADWQGPPRLVEVDPAGALRLNGVPLSPEALAPALAALMDGPQDLVLVRAAGGAGAGALVEALGLLRGAGLGRIAVVE